MASYLDTRPSFGNQLAGTIGSGIGQGLNVLAENKLKSLQQVSGIRELGKLGVDPQSAAYILSLPQEQQPAITGSYLQQMRANQQAPQQQQGGLEQMLGAPQQQPVQAAPRMQQQQPNLQQVLGNLQGSPVAPQLLQEQFQRAASQKQRPELLEQLAVEKQSKGDNILDVVDAIFKQKQQPQPEQAAPVQQRGGIDYLANALGGGGKASDQLAREKFENQQEKDERDYKLKAFQATQEDRKEILNAKKAAEDDLRRLEDMEKYNESGKLNSAHYVNFLKKVGLDYGAMLSPESQDFQKLEVSFLKNAKSIFGARVTNYEAATFLKSIPSLMQSKEGRSKVINTLKAMNEAAIARANVYKDIMKENKNVPPLDIREQVDERSKDITDDIYKDFSKNAEPQRKVVKTFTSEPPASEYQGKKMLIGGVLHRSDGSQWVKVQS